MPRRWFDQHLNEWILPTPGEHAMTTPTPDDGIDPTAGLPTLALDDLPPDPAETYDCEDDA